MSAPLGNYKTKLRATAPILTLRTGASDYDDLGNVLDFKRDPQLERVTHKSASTLGHLRVDSDQIHTITDAYSFNLDEHVEATLRLLLLATASQAGTQGANATLAVSISSVTKGKSYWLGKYNITAQSLTFGGSGKTEGTDFTLDKKAGILSILSGGTIANSAAVAGTINVPAISFLTFTGLQELLATAAFKIFEYDQQGWRRTTSIATGQIHVTGWGEGNATDFTKITCKIVAYSDPTVDERSDPS